MRWQVLGYCQYLCRHASVCGEWGSSGGSSSPVLFSCQEEGRTVKLRPVLSVHSPLHTGNIVPHLSITRDAVRHTIAATRLHSHPGLPPHTRPRGRHSTSIKFINQDLEITTTLLVLEVRQNIRKWDYCSNMEQLFGIVLVTVDTWYI